MDNSKRIMWIDLSDMLNWRGHFTGIQRVVYNLAKRFDSSEYDVRYFHYDMGRNTFNEIKFKELESVLDKSNEQAPTAMINSTEKYKKLNKYVKYARKIPAKSKTIATNITKNKKNDDMNGVPVAEFQNSDIVIVLGGNWDKPGYMPLMKSLKNKTSFKFYQMYYDLIPIFDTGHVAEVEHSRFKKYIDETIEIADAGFAISKHTKKDLERYMESKGASKIPITVIRLGDDIVSGEQKTEPVEGVSKNKYILVVGTLEVRKNHAIIYYAIKILASRGVVIPTIVIAGKPGWLTEDIRYQFIHDPQVKGKVILKPDSSDKDLSWLYQNCMFTLYPSFYEGWGLPVAESLQYGKPCIASNSSSIPEIAGDLIDYHSPFNSAELADLMQKYVEDKNYLITKTNAVKSKYKTYSWDDTFRQVLDTLKL